MLRCLEERQRERFEAPPQPASTRTPADTATVRLNKGYSEVLKLGVQRAPKITPPRTTDPLLNPTPQSHIPPTHPPSSSSPTGGSTLNAHPQALQQSRHTKELNIATVELEHQRFEGECVIPAEEMNGFSPIDYWMVSTAVDYADPCVNGN